MSVLIVIGSEVVQGGGSDVPLPPEVTADEIAAGTETALRSMSPADVVALIDAHGAILPPQISPQELIDGTLSDPRLLSPADAVSIVQNFESPTPVTSVEGMGGDVLLVAATLPSFGGSFYPQRSASNAVTTSETEVSTLNRGYCRIGSNVTKIECLVTLSANTSSHATFTFQYEDTVGGNFHTIGTVAATGVSTYTTGEITPPAGLADGNIHALKLQVGHSGDGAGNATVIAAELIIKTQVA